MTICIHTALHSAWLQLWRGIEWTIWRACLGSCCDLNANAGRVWMNWVSYYLHGWLWWTARSVWGTYQSVAAFIWLRWLITLLNVFLFFLHLLQPQAWGVCRTHGATCRKLCFEFKCGSWNKHGEPTCNQCRCTGVKTMHGGKGGMCTGTGNVR